MNLFSTIKNVIRVYLVYVLTLINVVRTLLIILFLFVTSFAYLTFR